MPTQDVASKEPAAIGMVELHRRLSRVIDEVRVGRAERLVVSNGRPMAMIRPLTAEEYERFAGQATQDAA